MALYDRRGVFFRWNRGNDHHAFRVAHDGYDPSKEALQVTGRSANTGYLYGSGSDKEPRHIVLPIIVPAAGSGTLNDGVEDVPKGAYADLKEAWRTRFLDVKLFGDSAYWQAFWQGDWVEELDFDGLRTIVTVTANLVQTMCLGVTE